LSLALAKKDTALADTQGRLERERAEKFRALFEGEQNLRLQAENLHRPGRVSSFFNNPYCSDRSEIGHAGRANLADR